MNTVVFRSNPRRGDETFIEFIKELFWYKYRLNIYYSLNMSMRLIQSFIKNESCSYMTRNLETCDLKHSNSSIKNKIIKNVLFESFTFLYF